MRQAGTRPINIAVLGLGPAGAALIPYIDHHPRFELKAVCDRNADLRARLADRPGLALHADIETLCADRSFDAVYIATPTWLHAEHTIALLNAGKHVIVEKPMANSRDDAAAMLAAAQRAHCTLIIGHSQSFEATVRIMRAVIDSGALGRLRAVNGWSYTDWMYKPRDKSEFDRALGGGVVFRQAAHQVDILRFLTRTSPQTIHGMVGQWDRERPGDGSYTAFFTFADGVAATLFYSGYDHFSTMELTFGLGPTGKPEQPSHGASRALIRSIAGQDEGAKKHGSPAESRRGGINVPGKTAAFGLFVVSCEHGDMRVGEQGVLVYDDHSPWCIPVDDLPLGRTALLDELAATMDGATPVHDGQWGLANLEVCTAILESSERQASVAPAFTHPRAADLPADIRRTVQGHLDARQKYLATHGYHR